MRLTTEPWTWGISLALFTAGCATLDDALDGEKTDDPFGSQEGVKKY